MAGYGMRDGSAIIDAVNRYADYRERQDVRAEEKRRIDQERAYRESKDRREWSRQLKMDEIDRQRADREKARFDRETEDRKRELERQQSIEGARRDLSIVSEARLKKQRDDELAALEAQRQATRDRLDKTIGKGASGRGLEGIKVKDLGDGTVELGITRDDGDAPLTSPPNGGVPIRIDKNMLEGVYDNSLSALERFEAMGGRDEDVMAYVRATITTDPETGLSRQATKEEFKENLKRDGLLKGYGKYFNAENQTKNGLLGKEGTLDMASGAAVEFTGRAGQFMLDKTKQYITSPASKFLFGTKQVNGDETLDIKASKLNADKKTEEGIREIKQGVEKVAEETGEKPKLDPKAQMIADMEAFDLKEAAINEAYKGKLMRHKAIAELYIHGDLDDEQWANFNETGSINYSQKDLVEFQSKLDYTEAQTKQALARTAEYTAKALEYTKANSPAEKAKARNEVIDAAVKRFSVLAKEVGKVKGQGDAKYSSVAEAQLMKATRQSIAAMVDDPNLLSRLSDINFDVVLQEAMSAWINADENIRGSTITPFINTYMGTLTDEGDNLGTLAAGHITDISHASSRPDTRVMKDVEDRIAAFRTRFGVYPNDDAMYVIKEELLDRYAAEDAAAAEEAAASGTGQQ